MPDIAMCHGGNCPLKSCCYRHRVVPNEHRQSYFAEPPFHIGRNKRFECEYFTRLMPRDLLQEKVCSGCFREGHWFKDCPN